MATNITVSIDEQLAIRAREVARRQGASLNALIRRYLETLAGDVPGEAVAGELLDLMLQHGGHSGGRRILRKEAYEGRG
jgi:hypothetical protein